jgi:ribosomal protein L11 methyltransferase
MSQSQYTKYTFRNHLCENEVLIAFLAELPFDSFDEDSDNIVNAYIPTKLIDKHFVFELQYLQAQFNVDTKIAEIKNENWNEIWESNFEPIVVEDKIYIHANFHPKLESFPYRIEIQPKMAFGTGHHETTYMVLKLMLDMDFKSANVFDYGCGTGILGIMAAYLGAKTIIGVDNEYPAYEATIENCVLNNVHNFETFHGDLSTIEVGSFDVILANINRNVLLDSFSTLYNKLNEKGILIISGILHSDEEIIQSSLVSNNFKTITTLQKGNWLAKYITKA